MSELSVAVALFNQPPVRPFRRFPGDVWGRSVRFLHADGTPMPRAEARRRFEAGEAVRYHVPASGYAASVVYAEDGQEPAPGKRAR